MVAGKPWAEVGDLNWGSPQGVYKTPAEHCEYKFLGHVEGVTVVQVALPFRQTDIVWRRVRILGEAEVSSDVQECNRGAPDGVYTGQSLV